MAGLQNKQLSNAELLDIVVGLTVSQATEQLEALGYVVTIERDVQQKDFGPNATELVISCAVNGQQVTIYVSNFVLTPSGKLNI